jgi:hypothetical protein
MMLVVLSSCRCLALWLPIPCHPPPYLQLTFVNCLLQPLNEVVQHGSVHLRQADNAMANSMESEANTTYLSDTTPCLQRKEPT